MKKRLMINGLLASVLMLFAITASSVPAEGQKVVLIYKTTLNMDVHEKVDATGQWKYYSDTHRYYNLIEFDPVTRVYGREMVIHYYGKENPFQEKLDGATYEELDQVGNDTRKYVKTTQFSSDNPLYGDIGMRYGTVNLNNRTDIGWQGGKVAVAPSMRDKIVYRTPDDWKNFSGKSPSCVLQKTYTRNVNMNSMTLEEAFEYMSNILAERGYQPALKAN